jgi:ethanolamine utilization protein EutP
MNRKKIVMVGKTGAGKTTLIQKLEGSELGYYKTQSVSFYSNFVDTPGEFLEGPFFRRHIINLGNDAGMIMLVHSCTDKQSGFPPFFTTTFNYPAIGVVTKVELGDKQSIERSKQYIIAGGVPRDKIYTLSSYTGEGIEEIREIIKSYIPSFE